MNGNMAYDAADGEKPDDDVHRVSENLGVFSLFSVHGDEREEVSADVQIEHRADTDRSEEAHECRLRFVFNLVDMLVQEEDDGNSTKEEDQDPQDGKAPERDQVVVVEFSPGTD